MKVGDVYFMNDYGPEQHIALVPVESFLRHTTVGERQHIRLVTPTLDLADWIAEASSHRRKAVIRLEVVEIIPEQES